MLSRDSSQSRKGDQGAPQHREPTFHWLGRIIITALINRIKACVWVCVCVRAWVYWCLFLACDRQL